VLLLLAQHIDDSSTDSDDRKMPAVIIKSKKTRSAVIKSKKARSSAIASKTRSAAVTQHIDDSSTDSDTDWKIKNFIPVLQTPAHLWLFILSYYR
jgi:hypothetical protein